MGLVEPMVAFPQSVSPPRPMGEQRVVFHDLNWGAYQQILQALGENRSARLVYNCGTLEITMPLEDHEFYSELIGRFIYFLVSELGLKLKSMGSTTLNREDLNRGAEPDKAYYIRNQAKVAGRAVDLSQDPPPDLVVEIDITHPDIDKLTLYARMGVLEFWRYDGQTLRMYELVGGEYRQVEVSPTFASAPKAMLGEFLAQAQIDEIEAEKRLRQWVRQQSL